MRIISSLKNLLRDIGRWRTLTANTHSFVRIISDLLATKFGFADNNVFHTIQLRPNVSITYRRNKGDLWSLREVFLDECYRLPPEIQPQIIVDLGGNIGLTSLWMSAKFQSSRIIVVEPDPKNVELCHQNLSQCRGITVVEAGAGSKDGYAHFSPSNLSNLGAVDFAANGTTRIISMNSLFKETTVPTPVDLLKVDIEGGEADLFSGDLSWMIHVRAVVAEFHPSVCDIQAVIDTIKAQGFKHSPPHSLFEGSMDTFTRI